MRQGIVSPHYGGITVRQLIPADCPAISPQAAQLRANVRD